MLLLAAGRGTNPGNRSGRTHRTTAIGTPSARPLLTPSARFCHPQLPFPTTITHTLSLPAAP